MRYDIVFFIIARRRRVANSFTFLTRRTLLTSINFCYYRLSAPPARGPDETFRIPREYIP
jgi:hypothetical protein